MRIGSRFTTVVSAAAMATVACGLAAAAAPPASAAPTSVTRPAASRPSAVTHVKAAVVRPADAASSDANLSGLTVTGSNFSPIAPAFDPATHDYQIVGNDDSPATVTPTAAQSGATVVVSLGGTTYPLTAGAATVPVTRGSNRILVTVTSADSSATSTYRVTEWRDAAPVSQIVTLSDATSTVYGGERMTVTLANGTMPGDCYRYYSVGGQGTYAVSSSLDPTSGLTTDVVSIPEAANLAAGKADLALTNQCYLYGGGYVQAVTTSNNAVTYTAGVSVTSADIPAVVTTGSQIVVHGAGITDGGGVEYWLTNPDYVAPPGGDKDDLKSVEKMATIRPDDGGGGQGDIRQLSTGWDGNDAVALFPNYAWGDSWYAGSNSRTLHVGYCPQDIEGIDASCTTIYSKVIAWTPPVPTNVSFSPASGPEAGGTTISLRGRFIVSGTDDLTVKVGAQTITDWSVVTEGAYTESFPGYLQGSDEISFPAPASTTTGPVSITVTNDVGSTVARGTYTYSARPTITSIAPTTVANSGGSVITVKGTSFGATGTPTVIIGSTKSPFVTRVSATQLTAVVPAAIGTTGPVDVSVSSAQGGGISLPVSLNLVAPTTLPTVTKISPASGHVSDDVTVTGTGFGASGTAGVSVDGQWSLVTASSPTSLTFEVPQTDTPGAKDLAVGAVTGTVTKSNGFTVLADAGINTVTPTTVPSYATGNAAKVALDGSGFGSKGTVKVGSAAAVAYTATAAGTHIAGVVVPTSSAAALPIVVTPTGSTTPLQASVNVTGPVVSYVGPDPENDVYGPPSSNTGNGGQVLDVPLTGGSKMRVDGTGFGTGGKLVLGTTTVTPATWTNTSITFVAPAHAAGTIGATVTPTGSTLSVSRAAAVNYVAPAVGNPTIARIASVVDQGHPDRSDFDPPNDASNAFTLTGTNLAGTSGPATRVIVSDGTDTFTVVPTGVTATSLTLAAPRGFTNSGWKDVQVVTNLGNVDITDGINYLNAGLQITASPNNGLCLKTSTPATGSIVYQPATVAITNSGSAFGASGAVTMDGVTITPTSYATGEIDLSMTGLASDLAQPWGGKTIVITPTDTSLPPQSVGFTCAVPPTVTTTVNGATDHLTVNAGTAFTMGYTTTGFIGSSPFTATAPGGYEYVSAADFAATGFDQNVQAGTPAGAGDYYVRVALSRATYAQDRYLSFEPSPVQVTITGLPVTITPVSNNGSSFTYKGQLGDGSGGTSTDFHYTATSTADAITGVTYEYRDSVCESQDPPAGWQDGLPKDVALSDQNCGGDGVTPSHWDVRVASFTMNSSGTDRSIFYEASEPTVQITITPRNVAVAAVRADKVYDGTTSATLGDLSFTGTIAGDDVSLANEDGAGSFASATPGVNKPVTLAQPLTLASGNASDYTLTNPNPTIVGTITKAPAVLSLAASTSSVLLSQHTTVTITPTVDNGVTDAPVDGTASAVALTSQTPAVCTISGTTVTPKAAGSCTIAGTEAASTDYTAATAESDPSSTTETVEFHVFPAPQVISVIADNLNVAVGDTIDPTSQVSGLFDGDSVDNVGYTYYSGSTLLADAPTTPGSYRVVPTGGTLTAADSGDYSNPTSFVYVAGTLVITALPPTITSVSPASGPTTGGTTVTITGTLLNTVKSVTIGGTTLRIGHFTVNEAGTTLTFTTPKVASPGPVDLTLAAGTASAVDSYTYTKPAVSVTDPGTPGHVAAANGNEKIVVTFTPPASDGGSPITSYQISTNGGRTWHTAATKAGPHGTRIAVVTGLKNGVTYSVKVRAVNRRGAGPASKAHSALPNAPKLGTHRKAPKSEIAIPKSPRSYHGKRAYTRATDTSHNGTWAHPIPDLGSRQLTVGEAATLSKSSLFQFNSDVLTKAGHAAVKNLAGHLRLAKAVSCEGYTDYAGEASHEKQLSADRAEAVCKALVHDGAHVTFVTHGYGGDRPVVVGGTPQSRAANRRVVVIVTK